MTFCTLLRIGALAALFGLAACSSLEPVKLWPLEPVKPWQKGNLAKPEMTFGSDPLDARFQQHIYFSKENASGGYGVGGGGCGCN